MYYLGIDLGGTNIAAGVVDESFKIIGRGKIKTNLPRPSEDVVKDIYNAGVMAVNDAGLTLDDIASVGMGAPGTVNPETGMIEYANNLKFNMVPVRQILGELFKKDVYIENDANAAAFGECIAGSAKGAKNAVAITLGTGVGGGIIIDGKVYSGSNYAGAELGHIIIDCNTSIECTCGRKGCWEAFASASALIRISKEAMEKDKNSLMWKLCSGNTDTISGRTAFDAMYKGDNTGKQVVEAYIRYVGCGLVDCVNIFQPDVLCIGGGICKEGENLLIPLKKQLEAERYSKHSIKQTKLVIAALGNDAGIIGAAMLFKSN